MSDQEIIEKALAHKQECDLVDRNLLMAYCINTKDSDEGVLSETLYSLAMAHRASQSPSLLKSDPAQAKGWETRRDQHIATFRTLKQVPIKLP